MAITAVATTVTTIRGEVHDTATKLESCYPRLTAPRARPKPCHSKPNVNSTCCQAEPKPRTHVHHTLSSLRSWLSLFPPSSPLSRPSLLPSSSPLLWPSQFPWPRLLQLSSPLSWSSLLPASNPLL
ncbi:hypothetical protein ACFX14_043610 [Malus domestica]